MRIRPGWKFSDPGYKKIGSGKNIPDPQQCHYVFKTIEFYRVDKIIA